MPEQPDYVTYNYSLDKMVNIIAQHLGVEPSQVSVHYTIDCIDERMSSPKDVRSVSVTVKPKKS